MSLCSSLKYKKPNHVEFNLVCFHHRIVLRVIVFGPDQAGDRWRWPVHPVSFFVSSNFTIQTTKIGHYQTDLKRITNMIKVHINILGSWTETELPKWKILHIISPVVVHHHRPILSIHPTSYFISDLHFLPWSSFSVEPRNHKTI